MIDVAPVTTPASTLIVPSNTTADPVAGFIFNAAPDVRVKAAPTPDVIAIVFSDDVVIVTLSSPVAISFAIKDDAVILPPEIVPPTVKLPLVVTAPPSEIVIARSPSV